MLAMSLSLSALGNMLQYFRKHGFQNPTDGERGLWQDAHGSGQSFFQWLEDRPKEKKAFHLAMAGLRPNTACQWFEHFPVQEKLLVSGDRMSLVDVGGGMGHDAKRLLVHYPEMKERVCVLDLSTVIQDATAHDGIQFVGHDFFDPYPTEVRGAKAYYMRMILHDWPEERARAILANVRQAMGKDSLLLINEIVLPEKGVSLYDARMDFMMMTFCAGMERTERQWTELLRGAGFVIRSIWICGATSLIEAALDKA